MKFGACTWIFGGEPLAETARRMARIGLDGVELFGDLSQDPHTTRRILADNQLEVLSLTPDNVDLCHPEPRVHRFALDYYMRLVDFAAEVGSPMIGCHGQVGRVRAVSSYADEWERMVTAVREIASRAAERHVRIAVELLNRYEAHLLTHVREGLEFVSAVGASNVGLLLDAYHMNIEEADLPRAVVSANKHLFLFHAADSNRQAVGRGHIGFRDIVTGLQAIGYGGPVIFECVAVGPDPFTALKGPESVNQVEEFLSESLAQMKSFS